MSEPLVIGSEYFIKATSVFRKCVLRRLLPEMGGTARVEYYKTGELLTCRQAELKTEEEYEQVLLQRRKASYLKDREIVLRDVIDCWKRGIKTPEAMIAEFKDKEHYKDRHLPYWNRHIRQAKKWGFISDEITPVN